MDKQALKMAVLDELEEFLDGYGAQKMGDAIKPKKVAVKVTEVGGTPVEGMESEPQEEGIEEDEKQKLMQMLSSLG